MLFMVPLVSCIVSFVFAVTVLDQYFARRKPYQLVWAVGLFMYSISTWTEFWTGGWGAGHTRVMVEADIQRDGTGVEWRARCGCEWDTAEIPG
ncbi:MAG: hypothetical protein U1D67_03135 [Dehalococcoidia bacterium]|nr:hypothetical protein [Dehalococcoidia bacterium]MDZ4246094.1 hypothetical protein [Dehalococcoidia bacterium]